MPAHRAVEDGGAQGDGGGHPKTVSRGRTGSAYLKNAPLLPGDLLHGVPQDAGVVDAQGGNPTHHRCPGDAVWQCPHCPRTTETPGPSGPRGQAWSAQLLPDDVGAVVGTADTNLHHRQVHLWTPELSQGHWQHLSPWIWGQRWCQVLVTAPLNLWQNTCSTQGGPPTHHSVPQVQPDGSPMSPLLP